MNALDLIVGKPFSRGITVLAPYVIEKGVSPVDFRGVVLYAGAEPHSGLGGPWPLQIFFFPLAYEEKLIRPPQHFTAGPPTNFSQILPPLNQKLVTPSN